MLSGLGAQFAATLPEVVAATMFTEVVFAWPSDGRLFFELARFGGTRYELVAFLLLTALCVLAARFLVDSIRTRSDEAIAADA